MPDERATKKRLFMEKINLKFNLWPDFSRYNMVKGWSSRTHFACNIFYVFVLTYLSIKYKIKGSINGNIN